MKRVDALIRPSRWEIARADLEMLGVPVTVREVSTCGRTPPRRQIYRGMAYYVTVTPELELTAIVRDEQLEAVLAALGAWVEGGELLVSAIEGQLRWRAAAPAEHETRTGPRPALRPTLAAVTRHA